jgi:phosphodiesterase/alkaline phosphatase D-like protein
MPAAATGANWWFPQSIASGDPRDDSIILWTRVLDLALTATADANASVAVNLKVTAADNSASLDTDTALTGTLVANVMVPAYTDFDGTVRHKLAGLAAGTVYFYQFTAGDVRSKVGRFKTAPVASAVDPVNFAFMSCQDWSANHWGAFSDIVNNDTAPADPYLDFIVHLGDYIYETDNAGLAGTEGGHGAITFPSGTDIPPERTTGPALPADPPGKYATTLRDYRYLYKLYRSDARVQRMHERFPMVAIWDDHEFSDDGWQNAETYTNANLPQFARRRSANQAWFEFMPADVTFQELNPSFQNIKLYRDLQFGSVLHLIMTDERLYRQDHLIPENTQNPSPLAPPGVELGRINSRYLAPESSMKLAEGIKEATAPDLALVTMLGATQRDWWKSKMQSSPATWKVWGNEVSLLRMGLNGTKAVGTLIGLQVLQTTGATMTASLSDPSVQAIPKAYAGALSAVMAGVAAPIAITASFAILLKFAETGDPAQAVGAGVAAGLTSTQASNALSAIGAKTPTAAEIGICAVTVVAGTQMYMTTGIAKASASQLAAGATVGAMLTDAAAGGTAPDANLLAVLKGSGPILDDTAGAVVLAAYKAAKAQAGVSQSAQVTAGAGVFATTAAGPGQLPTSFLRIRAEVEANAADSVFVVASGMAATLGPFMRKFLLNADQWDGYGKERAALMSHLANNGISNVVAVTGDIHAFFAGTVHRQFAGEVKTVDAAGNELTAAANSSPAVMVDLVTAGISSTSWYDYLKVAAAALSSSLSTLVTYTIPAAATGLPFDLRLPVLDFAMGKVFSGPALVTMIYNAIRDGAAAYPEPESALGGPANIATLATTIAGNASLQFLCAALSAMGQEVNPWLKHVDTNAQGYAVVTATSAQLQCKFRHLNKAFIVGGVGYAPGVLTVAGDTRAVVNSEVTATVAAVVPGVEPTVVIS